ncbi:MAG: tetratricopeptide repeat protein [Flavobacteriales bacterium]
MSLIKNLIVLFKGVHKLSYSLKNFGLILFLLASISGSAQEEAAQISLSNNYVFEGNSLVNENFIEAEKKYRLGVSAKQNNAAGSYNLGNAYYKSELYDEAMLRYLEAVNNSGSKLEKHKAYHNIGNTLMQQKRCKEAVSAYKNALRNSPSDDESRYNLALAQECAKEQGDGKGEDKDKDENKDDKENSDENKDNEEKNKDKGGEDEEKKEGDDKEDEDGKPKDDNGNQNDKDPKKDKGQPKPQPGKMSPQQVKNLLEAMNNEEKKVQEKMNASKTKGVKIQTEKDW